MFVHTFLFWLVLAVPAAGVSGQLPHVGKQPTPSEQTAAFNRCGSVCQLGGVTQADYKASQK